MCVCVCTSLHMYIYIHSFNDTREGGDYFCQIVWAFLTFRFVKATSQKSIRIQNSVVLFE